MFGYLRVQKSELLVREFEAYKSVYCGLCRQLGKDYSFLTRLILSYDCTFYAMLLMSLERSCTGFKSGRCKCNPLKKCRYAQCESDSFGKASAFSVISAYYKLKDDLADSGFFKRLAVRLVMPFFSRWHKKAARRYPELEAAVSEMMKMQNEAEQKQDAGLDECAHPTANMLGTVLRLEAEDELRRRVLYEFGYHIGRWIYLIDAADDLEKDIKKQNFNPFKRCGREDLKDYENSVLSQSLARAFDAYNLIDIVDFKGILDNMLLYGFPAKQKEVIYGLQEEENERSV